jgi:hypothetical protein
LFPTHWRFRNSTGVSFKRRERAEALDWVTTALLAGFTVFHQERKRGGGAGRALAAAGLQLLVQPPSVFAVDPIVDFRPLADICGLEPLVQNSDKSLT